MDATIYLAAKHSCFLSILWDFTWSSPAVVIILSYPDPNKATHPYTHMHTHKRAYPHTHTHTHT